ncbi:MAG: hypothetical protein J6Q54_02215 [Oscillospiraceae bacterium]|nr:hypothetical protein [Oscillospiraceae bacterium]
MKALEQFALAIGAEEGLASGFETEKGIYQTYLSNEAWDTLLTGMCPAHREQFGKGSGGELESKKGNPPKMAAFASSSRMTHRLSCKIPGFCFEKHLHTCIGGVANLDGFRETEDCITFVEAKCQEPYSHKSPEIVRNNYKPLYLYLQEKLPELFRCELQEQPDSRNMIVKFFCGEEEVIGFDIKQMLCHLLGTANMLLQTQNYHKQSLFLYLIYDPTTLAPAKELLPIYQKTCQVAEAYNFKKLFGCVVDFLRTQKTYAATDAQAELLKANFRFALRNQNNYNSFF